MGPVVRPFGAALTAFAVVSRPSETRLTRGHCLALRPWATLAMKQQGLDHPIPRRNALISTHQHLCRSAERTWCEPADSEPCDSCTPSPVEWPSVYPGRTSDQFIHISSCSSGDSVLSARA